MKKYLFLLLILTSLSIYSQKNMKKIINTENAPSPVGPYNQAILTDGTLYVSGQVALDAETKKLVRGTIQEETEKVMNNILAILEEVNFKFENVVKTTIFITDMNNFKLINETYGKLERFIFSANTKPLVVKNFLPKEIYLTDNKKPKIEFDISIFHNRL